GAGARPCERWRHSSLPAGSGNGLLSQHRRCGRPPQGGRLAEHHRLHAPDVARVRARFLSWLRPVLGRSLLGSLLGRTLLGRRLLGWRRLSWPSLALSRVESLSL